MLDHKKLDVDQCSIKYLALAIETIENIPRGRSIINEYTFTSTCTFTCTCTKENP